MTAPVEVRVEEIPHDSSNPFPLGRHIEHDPRSRQFPFIPRRITILPNYSVTHDRRCPIFNQGNLGSCTCNAGVGFLGSAPKAKTVSESEVIPYYRKVTATDPFPGQWEPDDTGSSGLAVAKCFLREGRITRYEHIFDFKTLCLAVVEHPVIVGVPWYDSMFYPADNGMVSISSDSTVVGGHEFLIRGIDPRPDKQHFLCDNSWGLDWSRKGRFWLKFSTMERLLHEDGDATVMFK